MERDGSNLMLRRILYGLKIYVTGNLRLFSDFKVLKNQSRSSLYRGDFLFDKKSKVIKDYYDSAGVASGHYFHQDLFVAREIYLANPSEHYDVGSRVDGFISHLAVFRKVFVFDIREVTTTSPNIYFQQLDIMDPSAVSKIDKVSSLSCLHTAEHFGLGRYRDAIDFDGWKKGLDSMTNMLESGGFFYFSTPVSNRQRVVFNAHRIFNPKFLTEYFKGNFEVIKTAAVRDSGELDTKADFLSDSFLDDFKDDYACGIWVLRKK